MNENDNKLLEQFFLEASQQEIADNGFSERVMEQLPQRQRSSRIFNVLSHLWTVFCVVFAVVVFVLSQGWNTLVSYIMVALSHVEVFIHMLPVYSAPSAIDVTALAQSHLFEVFLALFVLMVLSVIGLTRWANQQV